jgi:hypothetical protein
LRRWRGNCPSLLRGCLDETGEIVEPGKVPTTADDLTRFVARLLEQGDVLLGQEAAR